MRILLIDPYAPHSKGLNTGLGWLSASIKAKGDDVYVLDLNNRNIPCYEDILKRFISGYKPDIVGVNIQCITHAVSMRMINSMRSYYDGFIMVGGPQLAYERERILKDNENIDFAVIGEGEESVNELIECLESGESFETIDGLAYRDNGEVRMNKLRKPIDDLNKLPFPDYRIFGVKETWAHYRISTSRGCPYRCIFCNPFMGGEWRHRDLILAIEELKVAKELYNIREFTICEPVFNLRPGRVIEFCELLLKEKIDLPWTCSSGLRADGITDEMIKMMKKSGCYVIKMGVETLVPEVFKNINKGETIEDIVRATEIVKRNGLPLEGSFIIGLPGDTYKLARRNYELARKLGFDKTDWSLLVPYPGTPAYEWVRKNAKMYYDYKEAHQYALEARGEHGVKVSFETADFTLEERTKAFKRISWKSKTWAYAFIPRLPRPFKYLAYVYNLVRYDPLNFSGNIRFIISGFMAKLRKGETEKTKTGIIFKDLDVIS